MVSISKDGSYNFKVVLLGEGCVGKTSLILRYVEDKFSDKHVSTVQASFLKKKVEVDGQKVNLSLWDTAGQERFHALGPIYYRDSHGAILVYDITDQDSFVKVQNWVKELQRMLGENICLAIVGNKIDLESSRNVSEEDALAYAEKVRALHVYTSAKLNEGVEDLFRELTNTMVQVARQEEQKRENSSTSGGNLQIVDDDDVPTKNGCC